MLIFCACLQILIIPNKYILKYNLTIILGNNTIPLCIMQRYDMAESYLNLTKLL